MSPARPVLPLAAAGVLTAVLLTGCAAGGGTAAGSSPPAGAASPAASASSTGGGGGSGGATGAIDPCQVITAADASQLMGTTLTESSDASNHCNYTGGGKLVSVFVKRLPASAPSKAQAYYNKGVRQFSGLPGVQLIDPHIGDKSLAGSMNGAGLSVAAEVFLKGTVYVSILAKPDPGLPAMNQAATVAAGRV